MPDPLHLLDQQVDGLGHEVHPEALVGRIPMRLLPGVYPDAESGGALGGDVDYGPALDFVSQAGGASGDRQAKIECQKALRAARRAVVDGERVGGEQLTRERLGWRQRSYRRVIE